MHDGATRPKDVQRCYDITSSILLPYLRSRETRSRAGRATGWKMNRRDGRVRTAVPNRAPIFFEQQPGVSRSRADNAQRIQ